MDFGLGFPLLPGSLGFCDGVGGQQSFAETGVILEEARDFGDAISMDAQQFVVLPECRPHPIGQGYCFLAVVCVLQEKSGISQGFEV